MSKSKRELSDKEVLELYRIFEHDDYSRRKLAIRYRTTVTVIDEVLDNFEFYRKGKVNVR